MGREGHDEGGYPRGGGRRMKARLVGRDRAPKRWLRPWSGETPPRRRPWRWQLQGGMGSARLSIFREGRRLRISPASSERQRCGGAARQLPPNSRPLVNVSVLAKVSPGARPGPPMEPPRPPSSPPSSPPCSSRATTARRGSRGRRGGQWRLTRGQAVFQGQGLRTHPQPPGRGARRQ